MAHPAAAPVTRPRYGVDDRVGVPLTVVAGAQHVLAMFVGIVTPPLIVAGALGLDVFTTGLFISMALLASGLTTLVQVSRLGPFGSGLLSVQGTSFTFVPLSIQAGAAGGLPLILGMTIAASPVEMLVSRCIDSARRLFPPLVTGSVVMLIGLSLIGVGIGDLAGGTGSESFGSAHNVVLGSFVLLVIVTLHQLGSGFVSTISIALGVLAGYAAAALLGWVDFSPLGDAAWFAAPVPLRFGLSFDAALMVPWTIGYLITTMESIGDLTATSQVSGEPVRGPVFVRRLQRGVLTDGVGSLIAGVFNSMPNTTFSQNNGVIALTGVAARRVGYGVAGLLVLLGLFPKFATLVGLMPKPVLGGATVVLFGMVAVAGLRIIVSDRFEIREQLILAITLALGLGVTMRPEVVSALDVYAPIQPVLQSGLALGGITAAVLNLLLPRGAGSGAGGRA